MAYGLLTPEMGEILRPHIAGVEVWDLGAGDLVYSRRLLALGAKSVVAVDKSEMPEDPTVKRVWAYFKDVAVPEGGIAVALVAWPQNTPLHGLVDILTRCRKVVYLGSNTDGNACGNTGLFSHFLSRQVLAHVPYRRNSLVVYGEMTAESRHPLPEEWAALHPETMWGFDDAVAAVTVH